MYDAPFAGFCLVVQREWHTIYDDPDSDSDACASGWEERELLTTVTILTD